MSTGPASYTVENVILPADASGAPGGTLFNDVPVSGSVTPGVLAVYSFVTNATDAASVEMDYSGQGPSIQLINQNGGSVGSCGGNPYTCSSVSGFPAGTIYALVVATDNAGQNYTLTLRNSTADGAKSVGQVACNCAGSGQPDAGGRTGVGEPVNPANGSVYDSFTDYTTAGQNPLALTRYYNSAGSLMSSTFPSLLGVNWRTNFDRSLHLYSSTYATAERPDGQVIGFSLTGAQGIALTENTDTDLRLAQNQDGSWTLTDHNETKENYQPVSGTAQARLTSIVMLAGYTQTLAYDGSGRLQQVSDSYTATDGNRILSFTYPTGEVVVTTPDGPQLTYTLSTVNGQNRLASVGFNTSPATQQSFTYSTSPAFPFALTQITDENNNPYATWTYDAQGRAASSQLAGGLNAMTFTYAADDMSALVTNPKAVVTTYNFQAKQGLRKIVGIGRHDPSGSIQDASESFGYDTSGYLNSRTDWDGYQTSYSNNLYGDPTAITEGVNSTVSRTTNIQYQDANWARKPSQKTLGNLQTGYSYNQTTGSLTGVTLTDKGNSHGTSAPTTLSWAYAYTTTGQLQSVQNPNSQTTNFYYTGGTLTSWKDAALHTTTVQTYTHGGRPQTIADPNPGVTTTLAYTPRTWLSSRLVTGPNVSSTTSYTYDAAGNLTNVTWPDTSALTYAYDAANQLQTVTDLLGNTQNLTRDVFGNVLTANLKNSGGLVKRSASATFDVLGRRLTDVAGTSRTTSYAYDFNGNVTKITDPNSNATSIAYDALNRRQTITDPQTPTPGNTLFTYDAFDRPLTVQTPAGATTTYTYDGFGDLAQLASPDSGTTTYVYDGQGNMTSRTDELGKVGIFQYDPLDRLIKTAYAADSTLTANYTYDESGHGSGIGHLTSMTDQAGSSSRSYDALGDVTSDARTDTNGTSSATLTSSYVWNAARRLVGIGYPSGMSLTRGLDTMGNIKTLKLKAPGNSTVQTVISTTSHQPFGPLSLSSWGSGASETRTFDASYRTTAVIAGANGVNFSSLSYGYDNNDNPTSITDAVNSTNNQTLTVDPMNRITMATGSYGSNSLTYDLNGNRTAFGSTGYTYTNNSNRIATIHNSNVLTNADGNITHLPTLGSSPAINFTYYANGRLQGTPGLTYLYDGFGQRTVKTDTVLRFQQYGMEGELLEEYNGGSANADYIYLDGKPIAIFVPNGNNPGTINYVATDKNGTPQVVTDASSNVGWRFSNADPFGSGTPATGSASIDLRFPGQEAEVNLTSFPLNHNGWRDYVPSLGRYLETDPIGLFGGQASTYAYAGSSPLSNVDVSGLFTTVVITRDPIGHHFSGTFGSHAAVHVDNSGNPVTYDPGGSYESGTRGSGDAFSGSDADLTPYINYQRSTGSTVVVYKIPTTPAEEQQIANRIDQQGGDGPLQCSIYTSDALSGIGPFKNVKQTVLPGNLGQEVGNIPSAVTTVYPPTKH